MCDFGQILLVKEKYDICFQNEKNVLILDALIKIGL